MYVKCVEADDRKILNVTNLLLYPNKDLSVVILFD